MPASVHPSDQAYSRPRGRPAHPRLTNCCDSPKVAHQHLLADGPATPRDSPHRRAEENYAANVSGDSPFASPAACLGDGSLLTGARYSVVHAGSDHGHLSPQSPQSPQSQGGSPKRELTGLEWARAQGAAEAKTLDGDWAAGVAKELKSGPVSTEDRTGHVQDPSSPGSTVKHSPGVGLQRGASKCADDYEGVASLGAKQGKKKKSGAGCCFGSGSAASLTKQTQQKCGRLFEEIVTCSGGKLPREEAEERFEECFGAQASDLFDESRVGGVSKPEFLQLCARVKGLGVSEKEILTKLEEFKNRRTDVR